MNNYTVVIADDEPLVLIGLQDMIDWKSQGFEIIGNARNGSLLENEIKTKKPDLVITDIKMPVKTGIEVLESLKAENPDASHPLFIFLTSFEEFQLIKKAMSLEAVDYLVKLELDEKQLEDALSRARERLDRINGNRKENSVNELQYLQIIQQSYNTTSAIYANDKHGKKLVDAVFKKLLENMTKSIDFNNKVIDSLTIVFNNYYDQIVKLYDILKNA